LFAAAAILLGLAISWWSGTRSSPAGKASPAAETFVLKKLPDQEAARPDAEPLPAE